MSRTRPLVVCCALALAAAACDRGGSASTAEQTQSAPAEIVRIEDSCPVQVPATTVTVVNTKGGVAMYFTTTASRVDEVRERVALLARMEAALPNPDPASGSAAAAPEVGVPWVFGAQPLLVPLQAKAEDVSDGASLVLAPLNPMDLEQLRAYARSHADRMKLGRCPADFMKPRRATGPLNAVIPPSGTLG